MKKYFKYYNFLIFLFFVSTLTSCKKNKICEFPYVYVNITLGLISDLGGLGPGDVYFLNDQGLNKNGIIIYKSPTPDDYGNFSYFAFDRTCTYEADYSCAVNISENFKEIMECPCCHSKYLLLNEGNIYNGPAICPLIRYRCVIDGDRLTIRN